MEITKATTQHIDEILAIARELNLSQWSREDYSIELSKTDSFFLVAVEENGSAIGFIIGGLVPGSQIDSWAAEIFNVGVMDRCRRKGAGSKLVRSFLDLARHSGAEQTYLEVRSANRPAIDFYVKHGFEVYSSRRSYYVNPVEDATLMRLSL